MKEYFEFIEQCCPSFRKLNNGQIEMFSCPTQHITSTNVKELLDKGIKAYKEYGNFSPLGKFIFDEVNKLETGEVSSPKDLKLDDIDLDILSKYLKEAYLKMINDN